MENTHSDFSIVDTRLFLNSTYPYLGVSLDEKVNCSCCSLGYLEIKYPYCDREKGIGNIVQNNRCIGKVNDNYILKSAL